MDKAKTTILYPEADKYVEAYRAYVQARDPQRKFPKIEAVNELIVLGAKTILPKDAQDAIETPTPQGA